MFARLRSERFRNHARVALTTLTVAVGCTAFSQSGFLVNFAEDGPEYASTIHGIANTAGSIAGMVGTYVRQVGFFRVRWRAGGRTSCT